MSFVICFGKPPLETYITIRFFVVVVQQPLTG